MEDLKRICEILNIKVPPIVYIDEKYNFQRPNLNLIFTIAHDCRRLWQLSNGKVDIEKYKSSNFLTNTEYNSQIEELDAYAFAYAYIKKYYKTKLSFNGMGNDVKKIILTMANSIELE